MFNLDLNSLLIQSILPELYDHLLDHSNCILVAPPRSGKTSMVPLTLLSSAWREKREIILLESHHIATRSAANRIAFLSNEKTGQVIGYRTRLEKNSSQTIIKVVTQGLFLRFLLNNPFLDQIAAIIFDEIHERFIETDLCLALCHNL